VNGRDHCFHTIYYLPVEKRVIQDLHIIMRQMDGKAPIFTTVPVVETENGKLGVISTIVEEAPVAADVIVGKAVDDKTLKTALTGLLSGAGD
jgi:hypothetical protein